MRKLAMSMLVAMAPAIGCGGLALELAPAAHSYPSGPASLRTPGESPLNP